MDGQQLEVVGTMLRPAASFFGDDDKRILLPYFTMHQSVSHRPTRMPSW